MHVQGIDNFFKLYLYKAWLSALGSLRPDIAISCAALTLACDLFRWRVGLMCTGRWDVQRRLQMLLLRKYLSFDEIDLSSMSITNSIQKTEGSLDEVFRHAILTTSGELSRDCFLCSLHALSSIWATCFSIAYILYLGSLIEQNTSPGLSGYEVGLSVGLPALLLVVSIFFVFRARNTWKLWPRSFSADVAEESALSFLLGKPNLIKNAKQEASAAENFRQLVTECLWARDDLWQSEYTTEWFIRGSLLLVRYSLYALERALQSCALLNDVRRARVRTPERGMAPCRQTIYRQAGESMRASAHSNRRDKGTKKATASLESAGGVCSRGNNYSTA